MNRIFKITAVVILTSNLIATMGLSQETRNFWTNGNYVDAFGDRTDKKFITNSSKLLGSFSNSATEGSDLRVDFLINDASHILIKLFEYDGNNPVKGVYSFHYFTILIQNSEKEVFQLEGRIHQGEDRLVLINDEAEKLHNILMEGGTIKFRIIDRKSPSTKYNFNIENADGYDKAYDLMTKSQ